MGYFCFNYTWVAVTLLDVGTPADSTQCPTPVSLAHMVYYYTAPLMLMRTFSDLLLASLMSTFWPSTFMPGPGQRRARANVVKLEKTRNVANIDKLQQRDRK